MSGILDTLSNPIEFSLFLSVHSKSYLKGIILGWLKLHFVLVEYNSFHIHKIIICYNIHWSPIQPIELTQ